MRTSSLRSAASAWGKDILIAAALAGLILTVLLLTAPFANVPMNDDFSYARTAEALARTGHVAYNGWGSPLLWPQAAYGALLIRVFGFSYTMLAQSGVALAALATALFYLLARRCGCKPVYSLLATLALTMNPIFLSVAPSFMNDIPSLTLFLSMLLALARAIGRDADGGVRIDAKWLVVSTLVAIVGGSNRQLIWITDLAALAALFALVPRQRKMIGILFGVALDCAFMMNCWCAAQPYTVSPSPNEGVRRLIHLPGAVAVTIFRYLDIGGLLLLPLALLALPRLRALGVRPWTIAIAVIVWAALILAPYPTPIPMPTFGVYPYGQYFTSQGVLVGGPPGYSRRAILLSANFSMMLTLAGATGLGISSLLIGRFVRHLGARRYAVSGDASRRVLLAVLLSTSGVQFVFCFFWFCSNYIFDRYLLLFLPGLLIFLGVQTSKQDGQHEVERMPSRLYLYLRAGAAGATALMAVLGFGISQEYAAYGHARAELYHGLRAAGVPQTAINGGFELDADAQIVAGGYVNSPQVLNPKGAFNPNVVSPHISFWGTEFPAVDPQYRITTDSLVLPNEDIYPTPVRIATYHSLLPPFARHMYVYRIKR